MDFFIALILGVIQGLTEFLPVSSSAHLVILERLTGFQMPALTFHVFVHAGSLIALFIVFRADILETAGDCLVVIKDCLHNIALFFKAVRGDDIRYTKILKNSSSKLAALILISTVITSVIGGVLHFVVKAASTSLMYSGVGMFVTGILLVVTDMIRPGSEIPKDVPLSKALLLGLMQSASLFPGISRTASTYSAGIFSGFSLKNAFRISCLMFVPIELSALIFEIAVGAAGGSIGGHFLIVGLIGAAASAITGVAAIPKVIRYFRKISLTSFAYYSFAVGAVSVFLSYLI